MYYNRPYNPVNDFLVSAGMAQRLVQNDTDAKRQVQHDALLQRRHEAEERDSAAQAARQDVLNQRTDEDYERKREIADMQQYGAQYFALTRDTAGNLRSEDELVQLMPKINEVVKAAGNRSKMLRDFFSVSPEVNPDTPFRGLGVRQIQGDDGKPHAVIHYQVNRADGQPGVVTEDRSSRPDAKVYELPVGTFDTEMSSIFAGYGVAPPKPSAGGGKFSMHGGAEQGMYVLDEKTGEYKEVTKPQPRDGKSGSGSGGKLPAEAALIQFYMNDGGMTFEQAMRTAKASKTNRQALTADLYKAYVKGEQDRALMEQDYQPRSAQDLLAQAKTDAAMIFGDDEPAAAGAGEAPRARTTDDYAALNDRMTVQRGAGGMAPGPAAAPAPVAAPVKAQGKGRLDPKNPDHQKIAREYARMANGDKQKARELAQRDGWSL